MNAAAIGRVGRVCAQPCDRRRASRRQTTRQCSRISSNWWRGRTAPPAANEFRLLQAALEVSNRAAATASYRRLYFDFPAMPGDGGCDRGDGEGRRQPARSRRARTSRAIRLVRKRCSRLGRYADARTAFLALEPLASPEARELSQLRIAECDLFLKKQRSPRQRFALSWTDRGHGRWRPSFTTSPR
jgi:hypothetical protein